MSIRNAAEFAARTCVRAGRVALVCAIALGCARAPAAAPGSPAPHPELVSQLMAADRAFAAATAARGIDGWMEFMAPDAVRLARMADPVRGTEAIRKSDAPTFANPAVRLTWDPTDAGAFEDGRVGWTVGRYEVHRKTNAGADVVAAHGRYITMWRRAPNGRWMVILDTGAPDAQ